MARGKRDRQAFDTSLKDGLEVIANHIEVPVPQKRRARFDHRPGGFREELKGECIAQRLFLFVIGQRGREKCCSHQLTCSCSSSARSC